MKMTIALGADHRGFALKSYLMDQSCSSYEIDWLDAGTYNSERTDYPIFAAAVCQAVLNKQASLGILICGSGIGMAIAANRFAGIYAGLAWNNDVARRAKEEDNCNILVVPADYVSNLLALDIVNSWLSASFKHERYKARIDLIDQREV